MTTKLHGFRRKAYAIVAVVVAATTGLSALAPQFAAAGQATERMVELSDSTPNATGVTYQVSFKPTSTANIGGIVIDFCADSPIIGNTSCTYPSSFDLGAATPTFTGPTGFSTSTGSWGSTNSLTGAATNKQVLILTNATPQTPTGTSTPITFTITGVTNPGLTGPTYGTFFARIATFNTEANTTAGYTAPTTTTRGATTSTTGLLDYGGAAMNVVTQISITAKVQESLTFCASGVDISGAGVGTDISCTQATAPVIEIGHGGPPLTLDSTATDRSTIFTQLSTNASSGAIVRMKATNSCANGGLSSTGGAACNIPGLNNAAASAITTGTANFGLYVSSSATTTGVASSSGTVTPDGNYHDGAHTNEGTGDLFYGMDTETTTDTSTVLTTYGDPVMACVAPVSQINNHLVFGATASLTTQAGIYTANEILIATGTF
ncbi:MAG: hypothetical protein ABIR37_03795 [Candidatus Saccharimonadales bacterium]